MEVKAVSKNTGVPVRKMQPLVNMVRGRTVDEALNLLKFAPSPNARIVSKVVKTAAATAEYNYQMATSNLKIVGIFADEAQTMKRFKAGARRRLKPILKRSSHITVIVDEQEG